MITYKIYLQVIDELPSWDGRFSILDFPEAHKEILFWKDNIIRLNNRSVIKRSVLKTVVHPDISNSGIATPSPGSCGP